MPYSFLKNGNGLYEQSAHVHNMRSSTVITYYQSRAVLDSARIRTSMLPLCYEETMNAYNSEI